MNTRWGDAAISAPMHGGWSAGASQPQESPDLDRDLPPTPPQSNEVVDGVFIVHDEGVGNQSSDDAADGHERENVTISIPLPWKKRKDSHSRKQSQPSVPVINPKFAPPRRVDPMPPLNTTEPTTILPPPENRVSSPIVRTTTTSPALSFRSRLANPSLADILSPVAEGFAKEGPSIRATPPISSMPEQEVDLIERPPTASSLRSNTPRRPSLTGTYNPEGLGGMTMSSQAINDNQLPEHNRPPSRGIAATAHMRASSRGPRSSSRGPRSASVEPIPYRAASIEPYIGRAPSVDPVPMRAPSVEAYTRRAAPVEPVEWRARSVEPLSRRAPSLEPIGRRAPSVDPVARRAGSVEPRARRAPSVEPVARRDPSVEPISYRAATVEPYSQRPLPVEPVAFRPATVEPYYRQAPLVEPIMRRAPSVERATRMGRSTEPHTRMRHPVEPTRYQQNADVQPFVPAASDLEPVRSRAPSVEPGRRRAPSAGPASKRGYSVDPVNRREDVDERARRAPADGAQARSRRAQSRESRGRRGVSVEPRPRVRFHSEVARARRRDSFSSNDGSDESDEDRGKFEPERFSPPSRHDPNFKTTRKPRRRRSIASPLTSPTLAAFNISQNAGQSPPPPPPAHFTNFDTITSRVGSTRTIVPPAEKRPASRSHAESRPRGLYADVQDDFTTVAREVQHTDHRNETPVNPLPIITQIPRHRGETSAKTTPIITQIPRNVLTFSQRTGSPIAGMHQHQPIYQAGVGTIATNHYDGYTSDSSQPSLASMSGIMSISSDNENLYDSVNGQAMLAGRARDRKDQVRREERERAREKVTRQLEHERERVMAVNVTSDHDGQSGSNLSGSGSGSERTRQSLTSDSGEYVVKQKVLVPNDEDIWG